MKLPLDISSVRHFIEQEREVRVEISRSISTGLGVAAFMLGSPVTYVLAVVETWQGSSAAVWMKLLVTLSFDIFLAAIWPITWMIWIAMHAIGKETPITSVLGF